MTGIGAVAVRQPRVTNRDLQISRIRLSDKTMLWTIRPRVKSYRFLLSVSLVKAAITRAHNGKSPCRMPSD